MSADTPPPVAQALAPFFATAAEQSRERALVLARAGASAQLPTELLSFTIAAESFALPLTQVQEICRLEALTRVPRARDTTLGIMSLRGQVVPVVALAAILGLTDPKEGRKPLRAIVLGDDRGPLALQVGEVRGVVRLLPQDVAPRPFGLGAQHPELIAGVARTARGVITLLDGPAILRHLERLL